MKKIISVTLSLLLLSFSVSACSDLGEEQTSADSQSAAASGEATVASADEDGKSNNATQVGATEEDSAQQVVASPETTEGEQNP